MNDPIIDLHEWFDKPLGRYLLEWESDKYNKAVTDSFGFHALQIGLPQIDTLSANRMPHRWLLTQIQFPNSKLVSESHSLPFPANSIDLVILPHSLEFSSDPHATLREVDRVLVPEGRVIICGLNPLSLWGLSKFIRQLVRRFGLGNLMIPSGVDFLAYWRIRDWLRLLSFDVVSNEFGCYCLPIQNSNWLKRTKWLDKVGNRLFPIFGGAYFIVGVKKVRGMTLLSPKWRKGKVKSRKTVSVVNNQAKFK